MTVSATGNRFTYAGNGVTVDFSFPRLYTAKSELTVYLIKDDTGTYSTKDINVHYSLTAANNPAGGTVTFFTPPPSGYTVLITRLTSRLQNLDLDNVVSLPMKSLEVALDRGSMQADENDQMFERSLRLADPDLSSLDAIPKKSFRKSRLLGFDDNGHPSVYERFDGLNISQLFVAEAVSDMQAMTAATVTGPNVLLKSGLASGRTGAGLWAIDAADTTTVHNGVSCIVDLSGRRWKPCAMPRHPSPFEVIDLEYFLSRYSDHRTALIEAHKALFNASIGVPMKLECHGIQLNIERPILLRTTDLTFSNVSKKVTDLHIKVVDNGYTWQTRDFVYSLAGKQSVANLRNFVLERPHINLNGKSLIGLHFSGYYHVSVTEPMVRGMGSTAIGIYSSKYDSVGPGVGKPAGTPEDNGNHGMQIINPDIQGSFGAVGASQIGIYTEDGDFDVADGWLSWLDIGIHSKRGGLNTHGVHYSMNDRANATIAVQVDAPRACSFTDDEMDGCTYFQNPTDNMWTEGVSFTTWSQISCVGMKRGGDQAVGGATAGFGLVTFKTITALEKINGLTIDPRWGLKAGAGTIPTVAFLVSGAGSWDGPNFKEIIANTTDVVGGDPGTWPVGVRLRLGRSDQAGLAWNPVTGAWMPFLQGGATSGPFLRPLSNGLVLGRLNAGAEVDYWMMLNGGHLQPQINGSQDIGDATHRLRDLYLLDGLRVPVNTVTGAALAATLNKRSGIITTEALTTAAATSLTYTLTNNQIAAGDLVFAWIAASPGAGEPIITACNANAGNAAIRVRNIGTVALNNTINIAFVVIKTT
jgi:hypothetical protein